MSLVPLTTQRRSHAPIDPFHARRTIGTSTIGDVLGWDDSLSAALLAVATIVIPAIDVFFNSQSKLLFSTPWRVGLTVMSGGGHVSGVEHPRIF